jgi:CheY-like chemotaxis protein
LNRKIVRRIVESAPATLHATSIVEAEDGVEAVDLLRAAMEREETFDFILMDYIMVWCPRLPLIDGSGLISISLVDNNARAAGERNHAEGPAVCGLHHR